MAKKKKVVKKKATKKKATKKKVVKKKVTKKRAPTETTSLARVISDFDLTSVDLAKFGYEIPKGLKAQQKMLAAKIDAGDDAEKHASVILTQMKKDEVHLKHGCATFTDFCNETLNLPAGSVTNALRLVEHFAEMSLDPKIFKKVTPSHIHIIHRGFKDGAITGKKLQQFLTWSTPDSGDYRNRAEIKAEVNKELGIEAGKTGRKLKNYAIHPETGAAQEIIESCLGILKEHPIYGEYTASQLFERALQEFTANHSGDAKPSFLSADAALNMLAGFLPSGIVPVLVLADPEAKESLPASVKDIVDKRLVQSVFACFKDYKKVEVLAVTKIRAAKVMKVEEGQVRETPIEVDKALIPKTSGRFFADTPTVQVKPALPTHEALVKLGDDELKKFAKLLGFKVTARMSRSTILLMLLTDESYGMTKEEALALVKPKKKAAGKKKAVKKKAAGKKETPEEESEEESEEEEMGESSDSLTDDLMESEEEEGEGEEELTTDQAKKFSKANLKTLQKAGHIVEADMRAKIEEIDAKDPNISAFDRLKAILTWTRELCNEHGTEVQ